MIWLTAALLVFLATAARARIISPHSRGIDQRHAGKDKIPAAVDFGKRRAFVMNFFCIGRFRVCKPGTEFNHAALIVSSASLGGNNFQPEPMGAIKLLVKPLLSDVCLLSGVRGDHQVSHIVLLVSAVT